MILRDEKGRMLPGSKLASSKGKNKLTAELFKYIENNRITEKAAERLLNMIDNLDTYPQKMQLDIIKFAIQQFTVSADKQNDAEVANETKASVSELKELINGHLSNKGAV